MRIICAWCHNELEGETQHDNDPHDEISHGICPDCHSYFLSGTKATLVSFLEKLKVPVMQVNADGRLMYANQSALRILDKDLGEITGQAGGDAMECAYARLPEGCGHTIHCKACTIRNSVMQTFETGESLTRVPATLNRWDGQATVQVRFLISTQMLSNVVLLRIDKVVAT